MPSGMMFVPSITKIYVSSEVGPHTQHNDTISLSFVVNEVEWPL